MPNTPGGLPYPLATDPLTDGADAIHALALALDSKFVKQKKTTPKIVNNSIVATDLLNGEFTLAAGALGASGAVRLTAWGDRTNTLGAGAPVIAERWAVALGATTIIDTGIGTQSWQTIAGRFGWRIVVEILNLGAANAQLVNFLLDGSGPVQVAAAVNFAVGSGSYGLGPATSYGQSYAEGVAQSAVDTALAQVLALKVTQAQANVAVETKLLGALLEWL